MVNSILNAVTKQLGTTFGTGYRYYLENVEQGLKKPCFTVDVIIPIQRKISPVLYKRTMPIIVHYFSDSKEKIKSDCYRVSEQIVEALEHLPFNNTILRGEDISWQLVDDVLQVFITYRFTTKLVVDEIDAIEEIETAVSHNN